MRRPRPLLLVVAALGLLAAGAALAVAWVLVGSRPDDPEQALLPGLEAPATVRYDARRRPYVRARSLDDAAAVVGWLHARERPWPMELLRRAGRARLAEVLGEGLLATDEELLRAGVPGLAARLEAGASQATRRTVARYVAGVNAGLAGGRRPPELVLLGVDPEPWSPGDVYAVGAVVAFDSGRNMRDELLRLALSGALDPERFAVFLPGGEGTRAGPETAARAAPGAVLEALRRADATLERAQPLRPSTSLGSSAWAVAPQRSAGGHALFAFDSHDAWSMPSLFYEVHLFDAAGRALRGWTTPGLPGVINGWNEHVAWGLTNQGDSQDLFLETRDPDDPLRFRGRDGWYRARVREEAIPVRGQAAPHRIRIVETRNGPLVSEDPPLALRWSGHHLEGGLGALFALNAARDRAALGRALDAFAAPSAEVTWADVDGRVGSRVVGRLPRRGRGRGLVPLPGDGPDTAWQGFLPARALPRVVDPPEGFVAAANTPIEPPGGPLVSADGAPGHRLGRLREVLGDAAALDVDAMRRLQVDWTNPQAARLLPVLRPLVDEARLEPEARAAWARLEAWARAPVNAPDAAGALIWEQWYVALADAVFAEALGAPLHARLKGHAYVLNHALDRLIADEPDATWWGGDRPGRATASFARAVETLRARLGGSPETWRWDALHRLHLPHALGGALPGLGRLLSRGPLPWGGGNPTLGRARYGYDRPFEARGGASMRVVVELRRPPRAFAVMAGGQSGHFLSPHYDDQLAPWLAGRLDALADTPEALGPVGTTLLPAP